VTALAGSATMIVMMIDDTVRRLQCSNSLELVLNYSLSLHNHVIFCSLSFMEDFVLLEIYSLCHFIDARSMCVYVYVFMFTRC